MLDFLTFFVLFWSDYCRRVFVSCDFDPSPQTSSSMCAVKYRRHMLSYAKLHCSIAQNDLVLGLDSFYHCNAHIERIWFETEMGVKCEGLFLGLLWTLGVPLDPPFKQLSQFSEKEKLPLTRFRAFSYSKPGSSYDVPGNHVSIEVMSDDGRFVMFTVCPLPAYTQAEYWLHLT